MVPLLAPLHNASVTLTVAVGNAFTVTVTDFVAVAAQPPCVAVAVTV